MKQALTNIVIHVIIIMSRAKSFLSQLTFAVFREQSSPPARIPGGKQELGQIEMSRKFIIRAETLGDQAAYIMMMLRRS